MNKFAVKFTEVGRDKKSWVKLIKTLPTDCDLINEIKRSQALASSNIDVADGFIFAGVRCVGKYEITEVTA